MRTAALFLVASPVVLWFAWRAWGAALALARQDAKEAAALAVARDSAPFSRAYSTVVNLKGILPTAGAPWCRDENRRGVA